MQFTERSAGADRESPDGELSPKIGSELITELLEWTGVAALAVNSEREVLLATPRAQAQLHGAGPMRIRAGRLTFASAADQQRVCALVQAAIAHGATERSSRPRRPHAAAIARQGHLPWIVFVCASSASPAFAPRGPVALLLLHDPEQRALDARILADLFGFTSTEAVVAEHLAAGLSVAEIAARQGVSVATIRTQVARLLSKTHTSRQGELLSLLWRAAGGICGMR